MEALLSERINSLAESETIQMSEMSRKLKAKGLDIIDLSLGQPDFDTPEHIRTAAKRAIDEGFTRYSPVSGFMDLREAISAKFEQDNGLKYSPTEVVVSTGAKQSLANVMLSLLNPGDEVILPCPYWVSYREMIKLAKGSFVLVHTTVEDDFKIKPEQLEAAISKRTRVFCFSSPCNPTGTVYTKSELEQLARVLERHPDIIIVSDEIYEYINFTDRHESIGQFDFISDRVVTVNGVSKGFAMTGWRIGYLGAPLWLAKACDKMQGQITSGASAISQRAALEAIISPKSVETRTTMRNAFLRRRDLVISLFAENPNLKNNVPEGAFYVFPDASHYLGLSDGKQTYDDIDALCMYLLNEGHVSVVTGNAFGDANCFRFSYATSEENIKKAVEWINHALDKLH